MTSTPRGVTLTPQQIETLIVARATAGMSLAGVAALVGVTRGAIHQFESGAAAPSWHVLKRWATAVGCRATLDVFPPAPATRRTSSHATQTQGI